MNITATTLNIAQSRNVQREVLKRINEYMYDNQDKERWAKRKVIVEIEIIGKEELNLYFKELDCEICESKKDMICIIIFSEDESKNLLKMGINDIRNLDGKNLLSELILRGEPDNLFHDLMSVGSLISRTWDPLFINYFRQNPNRPLFALTFCDQEGFYHLPSKKIITKRLLLKGKEVIIKENDDDLNSIIEANHIKENMILFEGTLQSLYYPIPENEYITCFRMERVRLGGDYGYDVCLPLAERARVIDEITWEEQKRKTAEYGEYIYYQLDQFNADKKWKKISSCSGSKDKKNCSQWMELINNPTELIRDES